MCMQRAGQGGGGIGRDGGRGGYLAAIEIMHTASVNVTSH
jgi:hypothetical protein